MRKHEGNPCASPGLEQEVAGAEMLLLSMLRVGLEARGLSH